MKKQRLFPGTLSSMAVLTLTIFIAYGLLSVSNAETNIQSENCQGQLTIAGETTRLNFAYALAEANSFDDTKEDITVILTDNPITDFAVTSFGERVMPSQQGKLQSVEVRINPNKKIDSVLILNTGIIINYSGTLPDDVAELTTFTDDRIEGKVYLKNPIDISGQSLLYEASFKADIQRKIQKGAPTPDDMKKAVNSPQAAAYTAFKEVIYSGDVKKVIPLVTADTAEMLASDQGERMMKFMSSMLPTDTKFLRVTVTGETAVLETTGKVDGQPVSAVIDMLDEDGAWKFRKLNVKNSN